MKRKKILSLLLTLLFLTTLLTAVTVPAGAATILSSLVFLNENESAAITNDACSGVRQFTLLDNSILSINSGKTVCLCNGPMGNCTFALYAGATINLHGTLTANSETTFNTLIEGGVTYNIYLNDGAVLGSTVSTGNATVNYYGFVPASADTNMGTVSITETADYYVTKGQSYMVTATANDGYEFVNWTDESGEEVSKNASFSYTIPALTKNSTLKANFKEVAPATHTSYAAFTAVDSSKYGNYKVRFTFQKRNTLTTSKTLSDLFPDCSGPLTFNCNISDIPAGDELTSAVLVQ